MIEIVSSSLTAFLLGIAHAAEPGHGKTALGARAASGSCSVREIITTSALSAAVHIGVLALVALLSHQLIFHSGDHNHHWTFQCLTLVSSICLIVAGIMQFRPSSDSRSCSCCVSERKAAKLAGTPMLIGLSIGLVPCPTMIAVFFSALSVGSSFTSIMFWVLLFGLGMAMTLAAAGVLVYCFGQKLQGRFGALNFSGLGRKVSGVLMLSLAVFQFATSNH